MLATDFPFGQFFELNGAPLTSGRIYYGVAGANPVTSPITVYWDSLGTLPAAQPVRTLNGYPVRNGAPALIFADVAYSMLVLNQRGEQVFFLSDSSKLPSSIGLSTGSSLVGYISDAAGALARTMQARGRERVSILDFGPAGQGVAADDTAALLAAVAYVNDNYSTSNYKHQIFLPAANYLFERIEMQSLRGLTFVGEGTMDATRRKTRWAYSGPGSEDAALVIRSCAYIKFIGVIFDLNSAESMDNLVLFSANESTAAAPLNRFSNLWITFEDCAFYVQPAITTKPTAAIWAKSCGNVLFRRCNLYCGDTVALKLGADTDVDPDTGQPTFANGLCVITTLEGCYLRGDIQREKSYQLRIVDTNFGVRNDVDTEISRITLSGAELTFNDVIDNCAWDRTGVTNFTGTLIEGGTHVDSSGLRVTGCQLDGQRTLVKVNRGDAFVAGNRPVAYSGASPNWFIAIMSTAGNVIAQSNNEAGYLSVNTSGNPILATMVHDERASRFGPTITASELALAVTLPAAGAYQSFLSTTHKFGGGYVRISYSITIQHKDGGNTRAYTSRVLLDGVLVEGTVRRASLTVADEYATLAMTHVVYIDATDDAVTIELEAQQGSGAGPFGIVQGADTVARSTWSVELLTF